MSRKNSFPKPLPLKQTLKEYGVRYWQIIQRCASNGVYLSEPTLSRILNGVEKPKPDVERQLKLIEIRLRKIPKW